MESKWVTPKERIWVKNGQVYLEPDTYSVDGLQKIIVQVSDLTFIPDTVRLMLIFHSATIIVPSMHPSYDGLFEELGKVVRIDNDAYLRAMNCDIDCEFIIFDKKA